MLVVATTHGYWLVMDGGCEVLSVRSTGSFLFLLAASCFVRLFGWLLDAVGTGKKC